MAVGTGMEVGQKEADFAAQATSEMARALIDLLRALSRNGRERYDDEPDRGMKVISRHVEQGGALRQSFMDRKDEDLFAVTLKEAHIPYMRFVIKTADGEKAVFLTRGGASSDRPLPDDGPKLERAWAAFVKRMMERMQGMKTQEMRDQGQIAENSRRRRDGHEIDHM